MLPIEPSRVRSRCASCSLELRPSSKFCLGCNAPVSPLDPDGLRRRLLADPEPLLHHLARLGEASFHYYPRSFGAERSFYYDFADRRFAAQNGSVHATKCSVTPHEGLKHQLLISGTFQPGSLSFTLLLVSYPDYTEEEAEQIYCKGDLIVSDKCMGTAVYRNTPLEPLRDHQQPVVLFHPNNYTVTCSINGAAPMKIGAKYATERNTSTLFVLHFSNGDVHVPPPASGELWLEVLGDGIKYVLGATQTQHLPKQ